MTDSPRDQRPSGADRPPHRRGAFGKQVQARRVEFERQVQSTRAQLDATSERIRARTGRNLIGAIAIGLGMGLALLASLIFVKALFMIVAAALVVFATLELTDALGRSGRRVPRIASTIAAVAVVPASYYLNSDGKWLVTLGGIAFVLLWRLGQSLAPANRSGGRRLLRDLLACVLVQVYVPFLASFAVLLVARPSGEWWTLAFLILVIAVDTGAYASGLSFGKHPMAPTISPKKTWEGFAGAAAASIVAGILLSSFMLAAPWWFGFVFGPVLLVTATLGDLAESLIKRDMGVKDMSSWLPGHGGVLDRLDSILPSAAAAFALYLIFTPLFA